MKLSDLPTSTFNQIIRDFRSTGWKKIEEYDNVDAWIDYGMVVQKNKGIRLRFEWDNWTEGTIEGPDETVQRIKSQYALEQSK